MELHRGDVAATCGGGGQGTTYIKGGARGGTARRLKIPVGQMSTSPYFSK